MDTSPLMTPPQLAELLGVSVQQVYRMSHEGQLPKVKISRRCLRFRRSEIQQWLKQKSIKPDPNSDRLAEGTC